VLAFPGISRAFPADAALGLSLRIIGEKNTIVNTIVGQPPGANRYILTNIDPETIHIFAMIFPWAPDGTKFLYFHIGTILKN